MQKIVSFQHHVIIIYSYCLTLFQDEIVPELPAAAKKETAWERGLKLAKEVRSAVYIPVFYIKKRDFDILHSNNLRLRFGRRSIR